MRINRVIVLLVIMSFFAVGANAAAFKTGEKLKFSISWNEIVQAGTATMTVKGVKMFNDHKVYHIVTTAQSGSYLDSFFYVRDRVETYIDTKTFASWKYEKHLVEGDYRNDAVIYYNPDEGTCTRDTSTMRALDDAVDVLAAFYMLRNMDLTVGETVHFNYCDGKINKEIPVKVIKKEKITVPAGTFNTIKIAPELDETEGIFKQEGEMTIWLADDETKMPVKMASKVTIGEVVATLESY
ncbi:MAG: DUF3108 domain-containing protein [bacterium]|nr:DUF3108 domain-containing protein [bacterium]